MTFTPVSPLIASAAKTSVLAGLGALVLGLVVLSGIQWRRLYKMRLLERDRLEAAVITRTTELFDANVELAREIADRKVAERKRQEAQMGLVQAAKLASLGQALAGVAHEISQPTAALRTQIWSAKKLSADGPPELLNLLQSMDVVVVRVSSLIGHLKTFARKDEVIRIQSNLLHMIDNSLALTKHLAQNRCEVRKCYDTEKPVQVVGNPIHIEQILINLISNAMDATEKVSEPVVELRVKETSSEAVIVVKDNGQGVDANIKQTLFDPFVTTKGPGRGLGLGLSITYDLVVAMGGRIEVVSEPGSGSEFVVIFPKSTHSGARS